MRVIFLDIDGVLVTRRPCIMEEKLLQNLARVVRESGAKIVLSSDWRRHPEARAEAQQVLASVGLEIIGCTPCKSPYLAQRPTEILEWKREFMRTHPGEKWENWVAIDDRELLTEQNGRFLRGHFVQTHPLRGLTVEAADACIALLRQEVTKADAGAVGPLHPGVPRSGSFEVSSANPTGRAATAEEDAPVRQRPQATPGRPAPAASHISAAHAARALRVHGTAPLQARRPSDSVAVASRTAPARRPRPRSVDAGVVDRR